MTSYVTPDDIRTRFSSAMSAMYRQEVPQYGILLDLVADINRACLEADPELRRNLQAQGELDRLDVERHGAIRLGTADELATVRRIFRVMGMYPVGYYDLSVAGVPVHSTAFRPVDTEALRINPFRVFTSLLRLELIEDPSLRNTAAQILSRRRIFTERALELLAQCESQGGLNHEQADTFVAEVLETFRWHSDATVDLQTYRQLHAAHRLIADVVCFKGPHINHLTPRTLDIDAVQQEMPRRGIRAKEIVEGPPRRKHAILLRQTSFKALEEPIRFVGNEAMGTHTARFGEIEQRGMALTRNGRALYDRLLSRVREMGSTGNTNQDYAHRLAQVFQAFPDDLDTLRKDVLAFFSYRITDDAALKRLAVSGAPFDPDDFVKQGVLAADPITYEDFLPVSAAGIFQSNLGDTAQRAYAAKAAKSVFEDALQSPVQDEFALYAQAQETSLNGIRSIYMDWSVQ